MKTDAKPPSNGRNFFTVKEAADYCAINIHTMYRQARIPSKKGGPPKRRFGSVYRFPKAKFIAWAESSNED